jgi:hypothetical protein
MLSTPSPFHNLEETKQATTITIAANAPLTSWTSTQRTRSDTVTQAFAGTSVRAISLSPLLHLDQS